jgi:hypothetical protein
MNVVTHAEGCECSKCLRSRIAAACGVAERFGMIDGTHHKQWVIDQMLRLLLGDRYETWVEAMNSDGDYLPWDRGIAP